VSQKTAGVYHLRPRQNKRSVSNEASHRLATMTTSPRSDLARKILDGNDADLEYRKVANITEESSDILDYSYRVTQNDRGTWSERLNPESKFLETNFPRSTMIGDVLVFESVAWIVGADGFIETPGKFYED